MPSFSTSLPGTFTDSPDTIATQLGNVQLSEPTSPMDVPVKELALEELKNGESTELLDAIDELRYQGISDKINLPQLIVCGDQSSGKSSLLEAITKLAFPTKDGICTTFATEVVLRRSAHNEVKVTIIPALSRSEAEKARLQRFEATFTNPSDFPAIVADAKRYMNPQSSSPAEGAAERSTGAKTINEDILHVDISGPHRTSLTIVDLPGLIQSESRGQTAADVRIVKETVRKYMSNKRAVILAVVAAHYDFANQEILRLASQADPEGQRTLGIITKPDRLNEGTEEENLVLSLAKNEQYYLNLGWHVIKNRDHRMEGCSLEERDRAEREFFEKGVWKSVAKKNVGVDALRKRLAGILLQQIRKELPVLTDEIKKSIDDCEMQLERLGESRESPEEQRAFLVNISKSFERLTLESVQGTYQHPFFNTKSDGDDSKARRLRAVVQNSNEDFAYVMQEYGHRNTIISKEPIRRDVKQTLLDGHPIPSLLESLAPQPREISEHEYLKQIQDMVRNRRGRELPGTYNPLLIGDVFRKQAGPWATIAKEHAELIWDAAFEFLKTLLGTLTEGHTYFALLEEHIQPIMEEKKEALLIKIEELLKPYNISHLITYHPLFVESVDRIRKERVQDSTLQSLASRYGNGRIDTTLEEIARVIASTDADAQDQFASVELLYCMKAFYKVALHNFVDNIATLAVESCLISDLPEIFAPAVVAKMPDDVLSNLASESEETKSERLELQGRLKSLKAGYRIVRRHEGKAPQPAPKNSAPAPTSPPKRVPTWQGAPTRSTTPTPQPADPGPSSSSFSPAPSLSKTVQSATSSALPTPGNSPDRHKGQVLSRPTEARRRAQGYSVPEQVFKEFLEHFGKEESIFESSKSGDGNESSDSSVTALAADLAQFSISDPGNP